MRAIQVQRHGGPEVLELVDLPVRDPGAGEVRVRHHAIGINFIDTYFRSGLYKVPLPLVPGSEGAGVVDAVGPGVTQFQVGDRVAYAANGPGSYAEARTLEAAQLVKLPDAIAFDTAAAMMLKGLTVQYLLLRTSPQGGLHAGDTIVWHAAAGGVGLIAVQWAKALGLRVIGTAGGPLKCDLAKRHGADEMIDYHREDVVARVKELTGGKGVKIVYDSVGKDTFERSLDCLAPFGLLVAFGNASGAPPPFDILTLSRKGSLYITRPTLNTHSKDHLAEMARDLFAVVASGAVKIDVAQRYPLAAAARAHADLEGRKTTGAGVLIP
ncbi:MAG TPA: quinone oxidoreductase [Kofleriaceae bacterium]|nr:quinone oxidoreductase [Kofleriaceae bacterium]